MIDSIWQIFGQIIVPFLLVLTVLVYFHELGHYLLARWNGVKVEVFSVGFGKELFGYTDKLGTRWKFSLIPLGGYVKMFGDANAASAGGRDLDDMSDEEKSQSFHHKALWQRAAVVAAGPIANFILAIVVFCFVFMVYGQQTTSSVIGGVKPGSAAEKAGFQPGDKIISIDGSSIARFEDIRFAVQLNNGSQMVFEVDRVGQIVDVLVTPDRIVITDHSGKDIEMSQIGVISDGVGTRERLSPGQALGAALNDTYKIAWGSLKAIGQMIVGKRKTDGLSGPVGIGTLVGKATKAGIDDDGNIYNYNIVPILMLTAMLSISLGLINLFPIPVLDGGHLVLYAIEAVRGKPLPDNIANAAFSVGFMLLISLMVFATFNDVSHFFS